MLLVDKLSYNKVARGIGTGWDKRTKDPVSILVHTVNGARGTRFSREAEYIFNSNFIGAHYLIGKDGRIVQFLNPMLRAWHAGAVYDQLFNNNNSIGIEVHATVGEVWTKEMH